MDIQLEGRQVDIGSELKGRIQKKMDNLDKRFGPLTHARFSIERTAKKNDHRATAKAVVNIVGTTITASKDATTVIAAVNETLETLSQELQNHTEKQLAKQRR